MFIKWWGWEITKATFYAIKVNQSHGSPQDLTFYLLKFSFLLTPWDLNFWYLKCQFTTQVRKNLKFYSNLWTSEGIKTTKIATFDFVYRIFFFSVLLIIHCFHHATSTTMLFLYGINPMLFASISRDCKRVM